MIKSLFVILAVSFIRNVSGDCQLNTDGNIVFQKKVLGKTLNFRTTTLSLAEDDTVDAYCKYGFSEGLSSSCDAEDEAGRNHMTITCQLCELFSTGLDVVRGPLTCSGSFQLFESNRTLPGCGEFVTLGFGMRLSENIIKAGLCYDLSDGLLKSLNYLSSRPSEKEPNASENIKTVELTKEIININQYAEKPRIPYQQTFIMDQNFSFQSIILNEFSMTSLENQNIFKVPFWTTLWKGNWQLFLKAFEEHIKQIDYQYDIFSGVSGFLEVPKIDSCMKETIKNIPRYIWTYLRPRKDSASKFDSLVIIADNSPYVDFSETKLLCTSLCKNMDWLNKHHFGIFHLMPFNGLMYCCHPDDVYNEFEFFPEYEPTPSSDP